jgi:hypothetical protein
MRLLFDYGADANQTSRLGETALHGVLMEAYFNRKLPTTVENFKEIAMVLVENGAIMPRTMIERYINGIHCMRLLESRYRSGRPRRGLCHGHE